MVPVTGPTGIKWLSLRQGSISRLYVVLLIVVTNVHLIWLAILPNLRLTDCLTIQGYYVSMPVTVIVSAGRYPAEL